MKSKIDVTFNGFAGNYYYMSKYNGTPAGGGFDWGDIWYFTKAGIDFSYGGEHTGFNNDLHGTGVGFNVNDSNSYQSGWGAFYSPSKETFTLKSGDFASAWDKEQTVRFISYRGSKIFASVSITVGIEGQKIDFANYGKDFRSITKVAFATDYRYAVNEASVYGAGFQIVVDNLKAVWNGKLPGVPHNGHHVAHGVLDALAEQIHETAGASFDSHAVVLGEGSAAGFHSAITATNDIPRAHTGENLTSEFSLAHLCVYP